MKPALWAVLFISCFSLLIACGGGGRMVAGPDGNIYYELPQSRNHEDHCRGASGFSMGIAQRRSHLEFRDGKKFVIPVNKEAARKDLDDELANVAIFTEIGKRNYDKILSIFDRVIIQGEFDDKTPEQVGAMIYDECMRRMEDGTWFKKS